IPRGRRGTRAELEGAVLVRSGKRVQRQTVVNLEHALVGLHEGDRDALVRAGDQSTDLLLRAVPVNVVGVLVNLKLETVLGNPAQVDPAVVQRRGRVGRSGSAHGGHPAKGGPADTSENSPALNSHLEIPYRVPGLH